MVVIVGSLLGELYSAGVFVHNLPIYLVKVRVVYTTIMANFFLDCKTDKRTENKLAETLLIKAISNKQYTFLKFWNT